MGEILGLGVTHTPNLMFNDEHMADILRNILRSKKLDSKLKSKDNWPLPMQEEWGEDEGLASARAHREKLLSGFRKVRKALDDFQPDFVMIIGDDQYENFREDIIPQFCMFLNKEFYAEPFKEYPPFIQTADEAAPINPWNEPRDARFEFQGFQEGGTHLVNKLNELGADVAFAYTPLHHAGLAHAFINTLMYLDYDRQGFPYPIVPFHVNCYGKKLISGGSRSFIADYNMTAADGPTPNRCYNVGSLLRKIIAESPWRVAVIASSSWSHGTLTAKNNWLHCDLDADLKRYTELRDGQLSRWKNMTIDELEDAGQNELRNWMCLAGLVGDRKPDYSELITTYLFNSGKVFAVYK